MKMSSKFFRAKLAIYCFALATVVYELKRSHRVHDGHLVSTINSNSNKKAAQLLSRADRPSYFDYPFYRDQIGNCDTKWDGNCCKRDRCDPWNKICTNEGNYLKDSCGEVSIFLDECIPETVTRSFWCCMDSGLRDHGLWQKPYHQNINVKFWLWKKRKYDPICVHNTIPKDLSYLEDYYSKCDSTKDWYNGITQKYCDKPKVIKGVYHRLKELVQLGNAFRSEYSKEINNYLKESDNCELGNELLLTLDIVHESLLPEYYSEDLLGLQLPFVPPLPTTENQTGTYTGNGGQFTQQYQHLVFDILSRMKKIKVKSTSIEGYAAVVTLVHISKQSISNLSDEQKTKLRQIAVDTVKKESTADTSFKCCTIDDGTVEYKGKRTIVLVDCRLFDSGTCP